MNLVLQMKNCERVYQQNLTSKESMTINSVLRMCHNVLFDMIAVDIILCDGNYGLGGMELVHNREPVRSQLIIISILYNII